MWRAIHVSVSIRVTPYIGLVLMVRVISVIGYETNSLLLLRVADPEV